MARKHLMGVQLSWLWGEKWVLVTKSPVLETYTGLRSCVPAFPSKQIINNPTNMPHNKSSIKIMP